MFFSPAMPALILDRLSINRAASATPIQVLLFIAVAAYDRKSAGGGYMRLLLGLILGALFTVGGAYILDSRADGVEQRRMVNWDVVGQRVDELTANLQILWHDFTRQITGPP
jgi:hypothetical protein